MNNIKIKSYSLKKKTNKTDDDCSNAVGGKNPYLFSERKKEDEIQTNRDKPQLNSNISNRVIDHVNKLIKSPSLKFNTKDKINAIGNILQY